MECKRKPIKAHSIQNSKVLDLLSDNSHLIGLKSLVDNEVNQDIIFDKIGKNKASTFTGLCSYHDKTLFQSIDDFEINITNNKQLFLLAYRSVLKELHASITAAIKVQTVYEKTKELGLVVDEKQPKPAEIAVQKIMDSFDTFQYKSEFDKALLKSNYKFLSHKVIEIETKLPTIACSTLFSNDAVKYKDDVSRIIMNVFPVNEKLSYVIFSFTSFEKTLAEDYLYKCLNSAGFSRNYEISKLIIRNSENFFINPKYFKNWSETKKNKIINYFLDTVYEDKDLDHADYYLF